jgi:hypothetical protein
MRRERTQLAFRLISTHIILLPALITISLFVKRDSFLLLPVIQTILLIIFFSGYWEFLGFRFRKIYLISIELLLIIEFSWKLSFKNDPGNNVYLMAALILLLAYLVFELIKIILVISREKKIWLKLSFLLKIEFS